MMKGGMQVVTFQRQRERQAEELLLTPGEMAADMADYIFRDVKAGCKLSDYNRLLQQAFTGVVIGGSKVLAEPKTAQGRASAFAADDEAMQPAFPYEATATLAPISAYGKYRMTYYAAASAGGCKNGLPAFLR